MFTFTICFSHLFLGVINSLDNFYDRRPACSLFAYFPKLAPNCLLFTILTTKGRYNGTVRSHNRRFPCCSSSGMTALCSLGLHSGCASTSMRSPFGIRVCNHFCTLPFLVVDDIDPGKWHCYHPQCLLS